MSVHTRSLGYWSSSSTLFEAGSPICCSPVYPRLAGEVFVSSPYQRNIEITDSIPCSVFAVGSEDLNSGSYTYFCVVLVSFIFTGVKYLGKAMSRKKDLFWPIVLGWSVIIVGKSQLRNMREA